MIDKNAFLNIVRRIRDRKREQRIVPDHAMLLDIQKLHPTLTRGRIQALAAELEADGLVQTGQTVNSEYFQIVEQ